MEKPLAQCCIDKCLTKTKSVKVKDIIYYLYPSDEEWAASWERRIKDYDPLYKRKPNDLLCSLHFAKASMDPISRQLVDHALPVYFPRFINGLSSQQRVLPIKLTAITSLTAGIKTAKMIPSHSISAPSTRCCINYCPTRFDETDPKIPGFKFPDDAEKRKLWIWLIDTHINQKIEWEESMKICALHFGDASFTEPDKLADDAKPSLFTKTAVALRTTELEKKQSQAKTQQPNTIKISSINVPLHRANAENQSMIRRCAPIAARRLSLPYAKLPKLLPKPNIVKRVSSTQIHGSNGLINVHRIGSQNIVLSTASPSRPASATPKSTLRPVPGLNKLDNPTNVVTTNGQQSMPKQNIMLIRKSMRPAKPQLSTTSTLKPLKVSTETGWVPVQSAKIARMPPTLTPAPRAIKLPLKTYAKTREGLPIISHVHSIGERNHLRRTTQSLIKCTNNTIAPSPIRNYLRVKTISTEDDDPEFIRAINETKSSQPMETQDSAAATATTSKMSSNGTQKKLYVVEDESAYEYPRLLLERILEHKKQNHEIESQLVKLKRIVTNMSKQQLAKRLEKAVITETIEL